MLQHIDSEYQASASISVAGDSAFLQFDFKLRKISGDIINIGIAQRPRWAGNMTTMRHDAKARLMAIDAAVMRGVADRGADVAAGIDWSFKPVSLEQELHEITPTSEIGAKRVDKLLKVRLLDGTDEVTIPRDVADRARRSVEQMIAIGTPSRTKE